MQILIFKIIESFVQEKHEAWKKNAIHNFGISLCRSLLLIKARVAWRSSDGSRKAAKMFHLFPSITFWTDEDK